MREFPEETMSRFIENPVHFAADCVRQDGRCLVSRENIIFLKDGQELAAVDQLQRKCGNVVIIPDAVHKDMALLYHTSCGRMTDAVCQIFHDCLGVPVSLPQSAAEMTVGELCCRSVAISYGDCFARVEAFDFPEASGP
jgi:hypothetical protein